MKFDVNKFTAGGLAKVEHEGGYENIEFIGYMCKTTFEDEGVQETKYFTVNADGKSTGMYGESYLTPFFNIVNQPPVTLGSLMKSENPNIVTVNRFFRRFNQKLNQIESHGGLACIIEMNYRTSIMTVYPAFCSDEENFSKEFGLRYANDASKNCDYGIVFKFKPEDSIYENLRRAILVEGYGITPGLDYLPHMQEMFYRNFKRLFNDIPGEPITAIRASGKK